MLKATIVLGGLAAAACLSGTAHAEDGVEFIPFGPGGVQWIVSVPRYSTPGNYGQPTAQGYDIPFAGTARAGCFVESPWLLVSHANGQGEFLPDIYSTWEGEVFPRVSLTANVFTLQIDIKKPNGAVTTQRRLVTSAAYQPEVIFFPTPDSVLLWGQLDNSSQQISVQQSFPVQTNDEVRVSVCDLTLGSSMLIRHLILRTIPFDQ